MMPMAELFYGKKEDVWIVKPEKKEEVKKGETPPKPPPPTPLEIAYGTFFPYYHPPYTAPQQPGPAKKPPETKNIDFKVPICCEECNETLTTVLKTALKGVQKVTCDVSKEKVTVVVTNATNADDVLLQCRTVFRKSRVWTKDD